MRPEMEMKDAKRPLTVHIKKCHLLRSTRKSPENCMIANAIKAEYRVEAAAVHRNFVWVKFEGHKHVTRYASTAATRAAVQAFDKSLKKVVNLGMLHVPRGGFAIMLSPPNGCKTLAKVRSVEMKRLRAKNYQKRKKNANKSYKQKDVLTLSGVRSSSGYRL